MKNILVCLVAGYILGAVTPAFGGNGSDSLAVVAANGGLHFLRVMLTDNCLPRNSATELELTNNSLSSEFFVPAQLGFWITAAVLSVEARQEYPELTFGFEQDELVLQLSCILNQLESILASDVYIDPLTGKKALFQVYYSLTGQAPQGTDFEATVSMLDNLYLIVGLQTAANWLADIDPILQTQFEATLQAFDLGMWLEEDELYLGAPQNPIGGPKFDRILSEGRLALVAGLARGELPWETFLQLHRQSQFASQNALTSAGRAVAFLPFFGTALETYVPTLFLSSELNTVLGPNTLHPLACAHGDVRQFLELPAVGATGISNGFGAFTLFTQSPAELDSEFQDKKVLIPPAALIEAGILMATNPSVANNFEACIGVVQDGSDAYAQWGVPDYVDFGTGLVNQGLRNRSLLESAQATTALLNHLLGGDFLEALLQENAEWETAIEAYALHLATGRYEAESLDNSSGIPKSQTQASGQETRWLASIGDSLILSFDLKTEAQILCTAWYSNDDTGQGDLLDFRVNGFSIAMVPTVNTNSSGSAGAGWNTFTALPAIDLGTLPGGNHTLSVHLIDSDGFGVEIDIIHLLLPAATLADYDCNETSSKYLHATQTDLTVFPNPSAGAVHFQLEQTDPSTASLMILDLNGSVVYQTRSEVRSAGVRWAAEGLAPGLYLYRLQTADTLYVGKVVRY
ncbi:MAG: T9SS type A sorting domain-containing protein [Phaeodactylibacter sp.]|nr:T9SS type A sorting domain-containing protein [Phaeodactylibacter sp.]